VKTSLRTRPIYRRLPAALLFVGLSVPAWPAAAEVRAYDSDALPGDTLTVSSATCPAVDIDVGVLRGHAVILDEGSGTVTLRELRSERSKRIDVQLDGAFGPGAFVFLTNAASESPAPDQTGSGGSAPLGQVSWGVLAGWSTTGSQFCLASPPTLCSGVGGAVHGTTTPLRMPSATYDLGTWSFDARGDFEGSPYLRQTFDGGATNLQHILRGAYSGAALPALPRFGAAALAAGLLGTGARALRRKRTDRAPRPKATGGDR